MARIENTNLERKYRLKRYFSDSFKRSKVDEYEKNLTTVADICREYEVSKTSVYNWIYKYSRNLSRGTRHVIEMKSDTNKIKELKKKIQDLERIIGQKQLLIDFKDVMIDLAEKEYKVDIKKKLGSKLSSTSCIDEMNTPTK